MNSKNIIAAASLALGAITSTSALADEQTFSACTLDGKTVSVTFRASGMLEPRDGSTEAITVMAAAETAFRKTAAQLNANDVTTDIGLIILQGEFSAAQGTRRHSSDAQAPRLVKRLAVVAEAPACTPQAR